MAITGKVVGIGLGSLLGPLGAAAGAALGHWWDNSGGKSEQQKYFSVLVATAGLASAKRAPLSAKQQQHLQAAAKLFFTETDPANITLEIENSLANPPSAQECGQIIATLPNDLAVHMVREIVSVLHVHPEDFEQVTPWLMEMAAHAGVSEEFWRFILACYAPLNFEEARRSCLEALGLTVSATADQIKKAYRALSRDYHPDSHPTATMALKKLAEERMIAINQAHEILSEGFNPHYLVLNGESWIKASQIGSPHVARCPICGQNNRVRGVTVLQSRCGSCHARIAHPPDVAALFQDAPSSAPEAVHNSR